MAHPVELEPDSYEPRVSKPHISFSQVSMYLRCSMQYFFRYVEGLKQPPVLRTAIGKGGHAAVEYNGRFKIKNGIDMPVHDLLDAASTYIDLENEEVEDSTDAEKGEAKDRALGSIRVYHSREAPKITPAGVEVEFNLDLNEGIATEEPLRIVNGKIDLITVDAAVMDNKFVQQSRTQTEVDISPQLTLYSRVFRQLTGRVPRRVGFQMFLPGSTRTPPDSRSIERDAALMTVDAQQRRFERLRFQFQQVEKGIRTAVFVPTDDPKVCSWCGYRDRCQSSLVNDFEAARIRGEA